MSVYNPIDPDIYDEEDRLDIIEQFENVLTNVYEWGYKFVLPAPLKVPVQKHVQQVELRNDAYTHYMQERDIGAYIVNGVFYFNDMNADLILNFDKFHIFKALLEEIFGVYLKIDECGLTDEFVITSTFQDVTVMTKDEIAMIEKYTDSTFNQSSLHDSGSKEVAEFTRNQSSAFSFNVIKNLESYKHIRDGHYRFVTTGSCDSTYEYVYDKANINKFIQEAEDGLKAAMKSDIEYDESINETRKIFLLSLER